MSKKDDEYYMNYAINISAKANCVKGQVGAIIIKDDKIISEGVNSVPNGIKPCTESSCLRKKLNLPLLSKKNLKRLMMKLLS